MLNETIRANYSYGNRKFLLCRFKGLNTKNASEELFSLTQDRVGCLTQG